ncbi:MAG: hypothetical protein LIV24_07170 [Eubacterium sp.]|nr:hypothetical protein [Eubacterium sp.]
MAKKKQVKYTFIEKEKVTDARVSLTLSVISLLILIVTIGISFLVQAKGGIILGAAGLIAMLFAFYGFYLGMRALSAKKENTARATLSALISGVMSILWAILLLLGIH